MLACGHDRKAYVLQVVLCIYTSVAIFAQEHVAPAVRRFALQYAMGARDETTAAFLAVLAGETAADPESPAPTQRAADSAVPNPFELERNMLELEQMRLEAAARTAVTVHLPPCSKCKRPVTYNCMKVQRSGSTVKCNVCNAKHVTLVNMYGHWPIQEFSDMPEDKQIEFWESDVKGKALDKLVEELLLERRIVRERLRKGGAYLPLSVYEKDGYDIARIKEKCTDVMEDDVLGLCYRVTITRKDDDELREDVRSRLTKLKRSEDPDAAAARGFENLLDRSRSRSPKKASRKSAKAEKSETKQKTKIEAEATKKLAAKEQSEKRQTAKAAKDEENAIKRKETEKKKELNKMMTALSQPMVMLQFQLAHTSDAPAYLLDDARAKQSRLQYLYDQVGAALQKTPVGCVDFDLDAIVAAAKEARRVATQLDQKMYIVAT